MRLLLLACAGGAIGSGARYLVNVGLTRALGTGFPWSTLAVNIVGSFLMGVVAETVILRFSGSPEIRTFFATGILGGFTTFSAFSLDVAALMARGETTLALLYVALSVAVSIAALYAGLSLTRAVLA